MRSATTVALDDPLLLTASRSPPPAWPSRRRTPFHQWTPDVDQGADSADTTFTAVATKAAAFAIFLRLFNYALRTSQLDWAPALACCHGHDLIGNVGRDRPALAQAPAGLVGVAQAAPARRRRGRHRARARRPLLLAVDLFMSVAASPSSWRASASPSTATTWSLATSALSWSWLAWPMTIAMLSLAGFPADRRLHRQIPPDRRRGRRPRLARHRDRGRSMISLAHYLRVLAVMSIGSYEVELPGLPPRRVKPSPLVAEADARAQPEVVAVAILSAAATIGLRPSPDPLFDAVRDVSSALPGLH